MFRLVDRLVENVENATLSGEALVEFIRHQDYNRYENYNRHSVTRD